MKAVAGVFTNAENAQRGVERLRSIGIPKVRIVLLTPSASNKEIARVPTTETEERGIGKALGGVVGGAVGAATGLELGAAVSFFIPGVGPVLAAGLIGATLLGAGGVIGGVTIGEAVENFLAEGLPKDELFVYEDALRKGRSVIIALADDKTQAETARHELTQVGAETVDAAREAWWIGMRSAEEERYQAQGWSFKADEAVFRRGFEAALLPETRDKSYPEASDYLRGHDADVWNQEAFRRGYERGQAHYRSLKETHKA